MPAIATSSAVKKPEPPRARREAGFVLRKADVLLLEVLEAAEDVRADHPSVRARLLDVCKRTLAGAREQLEAVLLIAPRIR